MWADAGNVGDEGSVAVDWWLGLGSSFLFLFSIFWVFNLILLLNDKIEILGIFFELKQIKLK